MAGEANESAIPTTLRPAGIGTGAQSADVGYVRVFYLSLSEDLWNDGR